MSRTPEQIDADDALTVAIDRCVEAYHGLDDGISLEYVVIVARQRISDENEAEYSFDTIYRDNSVPTTRVMGLLEAASRTLSVEVPDE